MTHVFNVMNFHHRDVSLVNFAFLKKFPNMELYKDLPEPPTVELIGDLQHCSPISIMGILSARDPKDITFITDAIAEPIPGK